MLKKQVVGRSTIAACGDLVAMCVCVCTQRTKFYTEFLTKFASRDHFENLRFARRA